MSPTIRTLLTSFLIAAVAPVGLAALDLEQPAFAGNGNGNGGGNGGGHGGGNGGGNGGGHSGDHAKSEDHGNATGHAKSADVDAPSDDDGESDGLAPNELGKLNGVLHASPNAIAHANANSPIGTAREFGEALAGFLDSTPPAEGETEGEDVAEDEAPTIDDLGAMMANMTNKPVTADQVQAVADKLGIKTTDEAPEDGAPGDETADDQASEDPTAGEEPPALDQETAQEIADKANEIHGFSDDTTDDGDETADAGDTTDETATN
jgi:hypothetical protein